MNEREELIFNAQLDVLAGQDVPAAEGLIQALAQARLGVCITVAENLQALRSAEEKGFVTGLPGANGRTKWSLTDAGRHYRANR